jgi:hypothetical protein
LGQAEQREKEGRQGRYDAIMRTPHGLFMYKLDDDDHDDDNLDEGTA